MPENLNGQEGFFCLDTPYWSTWVDSDNDGIPDLVNPQPFMANGDPAHF